MTAEPRAERRISDEPVSSWDSVDVVDPFDSGCGSACTPDGCHETHSSGLVLLVATRLYDTPEQAAEAKAEILSDFDKLLAARAEAARERERADRAELSIWDAGTGTHGRERCALGHHPCHSYDLTELGGNKGCVSCERDAAIERAEQAERALAAYGMHHSTCASIKPIPNDEARTILATGHYRDGTLFVVPPCDCGLDRALAGGQ